MWETSTVARVDRGALAARLRMVNGRLQRRLRREAEGELGASSMAALSSIARRGPIGLSELAELEHVSRPTMTAIAAGLESAGLALRVSDPGDRRRVRLSATPEGRRLLQRSRTRKAAYLARRLRELSPPELATLDEAARMLERLLETE